MGNAEYMGRWDKMLLPKAAAVVCTSKIQ